VCFWLGKVTVATFEDSPLYHVCSTPWRTSEESGTGQHPRRDANVFLPLLFTTNGADSIVYGGRLHSLRGHVPPTFTNGRARGGTVSRTANKKLTKLY